MHIVVDGQSRYSMSNCWPVGKIVIYDHLGTFLGLLDDETVSLKTPPGIAIGATNRLYSASSVGQQLDVYGLGDSYLAVEVTPLSLLVADRALQSSLTGAWQHWRIDPVIPQESPAGG